MTSSDWLRLWNFAHRIFDRIVLWCNTNGLGAASDVQEALSEEDCIIFTKLLSKNISMEFILEMKEAFQMFDKNGDKIIDKKEIKSMLRTLGHNPTEAEILEILAQGPDSIGIKIWLEK